jgi:hypothetical protein
MNTTTSELKPLAPTIKRGTRLAIATWGGEETEGTVTRVERNVYGTEPGYAVKFDDGAHLVVGGDRIRVICAVHGKDCAAWAAIEASA